MIIVHGVPGWGPAISELMLSLADIPYEMVDVEGFDQLGPARERLRQINPLCQVSTLRLADGNTTIETAAIVLMILGQHPDLAPAPGTPQRQQFQCPLAWLVTNAYPTFTYADYPERWAPAAAEQPVENYRQHWRNFYLQFEQQLVVGPWALGSSVTLLDCYIAAMYSWGPQQAWFDDHAPKFAAIARVVCQRLELVAAPHRNKLI